MPTGSQSGDGRPSLLFNDRFIVYRSGNVFDNVTKSTYQSYFDPDVNEMVFKPDVMRNCDVIAMYPNGTVSLGLLMALAYKDVFLRFSVLAQLKVLYEDANPRNCTPDNLIIQYPEGGIECSYWPGYYYIPGYSSYLINKETYAIYSFLSKSFKEHSLSISHGRYETSMAADNGKPSAAVGIHRLAALTFLPYTRHVRNALVNHMDNNRLNNALSNLEWVTHKENNIHGLVMSRYAENNIDVGAKSAADIVAEKHPVLSKPTRPQDFHRINAKNLITGEILSFKNQRECARHFGCVPALVNTTIGARANKSIFRQRYVLKRGSETEWPDITKEHINSASFSGGREVVVKDLATGQEERFITAAEFIREYKFSRKIVTVALKEGKQVVIGNKLFKYADNPDPWIQ